MGLGKIDFERIVMCAAEVGISDIHIAEGEPVYWRRCGCLSPLREFIPTAEDIFKIFQRFVTEADMEKFIAEKALNIAWEFNHFRYRIHVYYKRAKVAFAMRVLPRKIPQMESLGQAGKIEQYAGCRSGLLLVTGATGSGKTTTVAALLERLNETDTLHILTLEDPIEFIYDKGCSLISQLEYGQDFLTYAEGVEHAMRESPDVIMVSEMRDSQTVEAVLNAAASGHFVIATMHAGSVIEAVERIISMYPSEMQNMVKSLLASVLVGIQTQQLVTRRGGNRVCAVETIKGTNAVKNLIRSGKFEQLVNIMQAGRHEGMQTMEMGLESIKEREILRPHTPAIYCACE